MKRLVLLFALLLSTAAYAQPVEAPAPVAQAENLKHAEAGFQVDVPAGWKSEADGDVLTVETGGGAVAISFMVLPPESLDEALKTLDTELAKVVTELKVEGEASKTKLNGMDALLIDGTGKVAGAPVDLGLALIQAPKKLVLVLGIMTAEGKAHEADIDKLIQSIRPL